MALRGEAAVALPEDVRLVIIANPPPPADHPFIGDVALSLNLAPRQLYPLTPEQAEMLPENALCHRWWLGVEATRPCSGVSFSTPPLAELLLNAAAKRALWQQICRYESDLIAERG